MSNPFQKLVGALPGSVREWAESRGTGFLLALAVQGLLALLLLTLGVSSVEQQIVPTALVSFDAKQDAAPDPKPSPSSRPEPQRAAQEKTSPRVAPPKPTAPVTAPPTSQPPPMIAISPREMAALDIANLPRSQPAPKAPGKAMMGPAAPSGGASGDSARVGTAPNGEPLYAASWVHEPYPDELAGYLSTAQGPGWGLIACRTVPEFRVEDCTVLDEWPNGSGIAKAVVGASWQFRVRPPRLGGELKVGEWVRIRIDYGMRRR
ncbi:hypothetical protein ACFO0A_04245 [Novosphingobium tardum]|uniref:Protein TonB n=1 Tax=Novosphingobium tardum TaxID=1538021 RepID=A0ABV8RNY2_9SPHN